jgi:hypothetical protein
LDVAIEPDPVAVDAKIRCFLHRDETNGTIHLAVPDGTAWDSRYQRRLVPHWGELVAGAAGEISRNLGE